MSMAVTLGALEMLNGLAEKEPAWWPDVCARIAAGTGDWEIAKEYSVKPALFRGWIGGDKQRELDFQTALEYRKELRQEKAGARLAALVDAEFDEALVNPGHVLKAIESTLGKGGIGVNVDTGGGNVTIIHESA